MSDIADRVKKIVVENLGVDAGDVNEAASFIDDLGADSLEVIVSKFRSALLNPKRPAATDQSINGAPVVWLLSLMECHHSIYYCSNQSNLTLFVQDPKAKLIKTMILYQDDIQRWAGILSEIEVS